MEQWRHNAMDRRIIIILAIIFLGVSVSYSADVMMKDKADKVAIRTDKIPVSTPAGTSGMDLISDILGLTLTADLSDVTVTQTELEELATIGDNTISADQWAGLGGATTAGIALWDDADAPAQLVTLGAAPAAGSANIVTVGALASGSLAAGFTDVPVPQGGTGVSTLAQIGRAHV